MEKIDWTVIAVIVSVTLGWFLNELSQWIRTSREDKKVKKSVLYNLLEIHSSVSWFDISDIVETVTNKVMSSIPKEKITKKLEMSFKEIYIRRMLGIVKSNEAKNLDKLEEKYLNTINDLALIDPITAYYLSNNSQIWSFIDSLIEFSEQANEMLSNLIEDNQTLTKDISVGEEPVIIKKIVSDLREDLYRVSWSINIVTWKRVKRTVRSLKNKIKIVNEKEINMIFNELYYK